MDSSGPCQNLFKWLSTFEDCGRVSLPEDISSGVVVAKVLHQIEPVWFSQAWLDKINTDTGDNWRLKARNLKKVSQAVVDYLGDNLEFDVSHLSQPDPNKLAEHGDMEEAARLVQLVLGVAINCPRKQEFIEAIRMLEPSVQTVLMTAIQQLMTSPAGVTSLGQPDSCNSWLAEAGRLSQELQLAREERDTLSQRCFEQQRQLQMLQSDKAAALSDLQQLQSRTRESVDTRPSPTDPSDSPVLPSGGQRYKQLRMKLDAAHDEIYRLETSRDELKSKFEESSRELAETRTRVEELQRMADESRGLKDELDILRERSSKMSQYESSLETYKRRLHEMSDLRGQIRSLEQKNSEYVKLNCELEEKVAKSGCYRPQLDICKQRIAELHVQLTEEGSKLERVEMERRALSENLATLQQERDRVTDDRDRMKEALEELRLSQLAQQSSPSEANVSIRPADTLQQSKLASFSNHPAEIRDELLGGSVVPCRREELQSASGSPSDTVDSGAGDFRQREAAQRAEIRSACNLTSADRLCSLMKRNNCCIDCCHSARCTCIGRCSDIRGAPAQYCPEHNVTSFSAESNGHRCSSISCNHCQFRTCIYDKEHRVASTRGSFSRHNSLRWCDFNRAKHCSLARTKSLHKESTSHRAPYLCRQASAADGFFSVGDACPGPLSTDNVSVTKNVIGPASLPECDMPHALPDRGAASCLDSLYASCCESSGAVDLSFDSADSLLRPARATFRRYTGEDSSLFRHERWPASRRLQLIPAPDVGVWTECSSLGSSGGEPCLPDTELAEDSDTSTGSSRPLLRCWKFRTRAGRTRLKQVNVAASAVGVALTLCAP